MTYSIEEVNSVVRRHIVDNEPMAAIARSSPMSLTQIKHYVRMQRETGTITIGKPGAKPALPDFIESDLVSWAAAMQRARWPIDRHDLVHQANRILANAPASAPRQLGRGWCDRFLARHPELVSRQAQKLSKARNEVTREGILKYFYNLVTATLDFRCQASHVYNMDETSFKTMGKSKKVIAVKGSPEVWSLEPNMSFHLTIVAAVSADGTPVPPAFIVPSASVETTILDACAVPGAIVTSSPKAFITADLFTRWLVHFGEWKMTHRRAEPAILILDNCSSHVASPEQSAVCLHYGIRIVPLPANATHLLQPLDVAVFRSFKSAISRAMTQQLRAANKTVLSRAMAIKIAGDAFNRTLVQQPVLGGSVVVVSAAERGFAVCGAWPLSLVAMDRRLSKVVANGVTSTLGTESWIKAQVVARDAILTVPVLEPARRERKRVVTNSEWFDLDDLHKAAACPSKKKKSK
jgi:hypothetical protein